MGLHNPMGESLARALERALVEINADGRRVVFVLRESWSIWRYLGVLLGTLLTLGLWSRLPGYLVIAERRTCDAGGACGEQRHPASGAGDAGGAGSVVRSADRDARRP